MKFLRPTLLGLGGAALLRAAAPSPTPSEPVETIEPLAPFVVTAARADQPLVTTLDAHAPAQPLPAQDGADYLKCVPGLCVIRKGGIDGDPVLRGQAGSRLGILLDGEGLLGGCGNRMDPPTAYVFPSAFDRITVLKGPQTVLHGPGLSAGVVLFERDEPRYLQPGATLRAALTTGSAARRNAAVEAKGGTPRAYARLAVAWAEADDYADGAGRRVHADYARWQTQFALGWTPDDQTRLELTGARSDGEAAYADRAMDGVKFDRDNLGLRFRRTRRTGGLTALEGQVFYNYVDHVMDNFSRRTFTPTTAMPGRAVSNPDRRTLGGRLAATFAPRGDDHLVVGADAQANRHTVRSTANETATPYRAKPRNRDADFRQTGLFGEYTLALAPAHRLILGARGDAWCAEDHRATIALGLTTTPNPTAGQTRRTTLGGGFARYEYDFAGATAFLGLGHTERFPDYWELFNKERADSVSAFGVAPEKTTQLDAGLVYRRGPLSLSAAAFANAVDDFILIQNGYAKPAGLTTRTATIARHIDAASWGGELGLGWRLTPRWQGDASLAYVRGRNRTDARPLAQQPPLEGRLALTYRQTRWSVGGLVRAVAAQRRYATGQGNIAGQDLGPTAGFAVGSLHASWQVTEWARLAAGVDNLGDKTYAEHISRAGSMVAGYEQTTRVNEPGRTFWVTAELKY